MACVSWFWFRPLLKEIEMNESLLNNLAKDAGMDLRPQWDAERGRMVNKLSPDQLAFAKAIIRECLAVVDPAMFNSGDEWDKALRFIRSDTAEHFQIDIGDVK